MASSYKPGQELVNSSYGKDYSLNEKFSKRMVFPIWADGQYMDFRVLPAIDPSTNAPMPMEVNGEFTDWVCPIRLLVRGTGMTGKVSMILNYKSQQSGPYEYFYKTLRNMAGWQRKVKDAELIKLLDGQDAVIKSPNQALLFQGVVLQHGDDDLSNYSGVTVLCLSAKSARQRFDRMMLDMVEGKAERRDLVCPTNGWAMRWSAITKQQQLVKDGEVMIVNAHYKFDLFGPIPVQDPAWFGQWVAWEKLLVESSADEQIDLMRQVFPPAMLAAGLSGSGYLLDANTTAKTYSVPPTVGATPYSSFGSVPGIGTPPPAAPVDVMGRALSQLQELYAQKTGPNLPNTVPVNLPPTQMPVVVMPTTQGVPPMSAVPSVAPAVAGIDPRMAEILQTIANAKASQNAKA